MQGPALGLFTSILSGPMAALGIRPDQQDGDRRRLSGAELDGLVEHANRSYHWGLSLLAPPYAVAAVVILGVKRDVRSVALN